MTPELLEWKKWNVVADLIAKRDPDPAYEELKHPVVLNTDGIALLLIFQCKAYFFTSNDQTITVRIYHADSGDYLIDTDVIRIHSGTTFREIATAVVFKVLE